MTIKKGGSIYRVTENKTCWNVERKVETERDEVVMTVTYTVSKKYCDSFTALEKYVLNEDIFA